MDNLTSFILENWELSALFFIVFVIYLSLEYRLKAVGAERISPQFAALQSNRKNTLLLDIRKEEAYLDGHIQGSHSCSLDHLKTLRQLKTLTPSQKKNLSSQTLIIIDAQGAQSSKAVKILKREGYEHLKILEGGISAWQQEKLPLVKSAQNDGVSIEKEETVEHQHTTPSSKKNKPKSKSKAKLQLLPSKED